MQKKRHRTTGWGWRGAERRRRLNIWFRRLLGSVEPRRAALAPNTRRILVVRLNDRLGNILFLTPMLRALTEALPDATVDILIQDINHKPLLESLPGVGRIWIQRKTLSGTLGLLRQMRRTRYDLAIEPIGRSVSARLFVMLSGARQRMGFAGRDQWLRLTHASQPSNSRHPARQCVELLTGSVTDPSFETIVTLAVFPSARAQTAAEKRWQALRMEADNSDARVVGFFINASGKKQLPISWWQSWDLALRQLLPHIVLLQICRPGSPEAIRPGIASVAVEPLDELAALMSQLDVFVAADSGPMHLAAAAGVPVVGLFCHTSPKAYAPLGHGCISLAGEALQGDEAARAVVRILDSKPRPRRSSVDRI